MRNYLEFEKEIKTLEEELDSSKNPFDKDGISEVDTDKIKKILLVKTALTLLNLSWLMSSFCLN